MKAAGFFAWSLPLLLAMGLVGCKPELEPPVAASQPASERAIEPASAPIYAEVAVAAASYSSRDLDWQDDKRQRAVPARLYLPAAADGQGADAAARLPLIVFSHGLGGSRRGYSYLGAYWASQGYASLHVQHVGSDRELWTGNVFGLVGRLQTAAKDSEALNRVADMRFALDRLLGSELGARIDAERIVAAGHSYGANTVMLLAGAQVQREGQVLPDLRDPRVKAAILISAPPFYGESEPARILQPVRIPSLHITATEDVIKVPGYYSAAEDRIKVFEAMGGADKTLAVFEGGSHSIFTARSGTGGLDLNPKVKVATRELSLAFLDHVFAGRSEGMRRWGERYGGLLKRWQPVPFAAEPLLKGSGQGS